MARPSPLPHWLWSIPETFSVVWCRVVCHCMLCIQWYTAYYGCYTETRSHHPRVCLVDGYHRQYCHLVTWLRTIVGTHWAHRTVLHMAMLVAHR
jgi:hypothetical protein